LLQALLVELVELLQLNAHHANAIDSSRLPGLPHAAATILWSHANALCCHCYRPSSLLQALLVELLELKAHHAKALDSRTLLGHLSLLTHYMHDRLNLQSAASC
jgi:hypothetical protein